MGSHINASFQNHTLVLHWKDGTWSVVPSPNPDPSCTDGNVQWGGNVLSSVAVVSASDVWAVGRACQGQSLIEHWNGSAWSVVPSPTPIPGAETYLTGVAAISSTDMWAVGYTSEAIGVGTVTEHWDGTRWTVVPSPRAGTGGDLVSVAAASASDVWAVGTYYDEKEGIWETLIEHWDGTSWSIVPSPSPGTYRNDLQSVAVISSNDVWAAGEHSSGDGDRTLVEHWDGHTWEVVPSPNVATGYSTTNVLRSLAAVSASDIWAAGMFQNVDTNVHQHRTLLEHWDGSSWTLVSAPSPGASAELNGIGALPTGQVWAAGLYSDHPINIYDGTYQLPQNLVLGASSQVVSVGPSVPPSEPTLGLPTPNPAAGLVSFSLDVPSRADITLAIFDARGRWVRSILSGDTEVGQRAVNWDGFDAQGRPSGPGTYFARLMVAGRTVAMRTVTLLPSAGFPSSE